VAAGRQEGEPSLYLVNETLARAAQERPEAAVESELGAVPPDEVQNGANGLAMGAPQPAAQLLKEQRRAVRWPQQQERVDGRVLSLT